MILDSFFSTNEKDNNFIAFMESKSSEETLTITSSSGNFVKDDKDDKEEPLEIYNELLREHIKYEKY